MATVFKKNGEGNYIIKYIDHTGRRRELSSKTTDKRTSERIANKLEADVALRREGVIDPQVERMAQEAKSFIEQHVKHYEAMLNAGKRDPKHIRSTLKYIRDICHANDFYILSDITADGVNGYASTLTDQDKSARTVQAHMTAIKGFTKWLNQHHKLASDPLSSVKKPNPQKDRRKERRMLLPNEWTWLKATTLKCSERYGMTGKERILLYAVDIQTGLRPNELRSLTQGRLFLDGNTPFITCKAKSTKNAKDARQYIQPDLAEQLNTNVLNKWAGEPVFNLPPDWQMADMIRADLADARNAWLNEVEKNSEELKKRIQSDFLMDKNHEGEVFDFYSLRHTTGAWLAMAGSHPKEVQSVMRHSTIVLTMDTYGHMFPGQDATTVARFSNMFQTSNAENNDAPQSDTPEKCHQKCHHSGDETVRDDATPCDHFQDERSGTDIHKSLNNRKKCETLQAISKPCLKCLLKDSNLEPAD